MSYRHAAAGYLWLQALLGAAWWVMLVAAPQSRRHFWPAAWPEAGLMAFWLPDIVLFVGGSAASGWLLTRESPHRHAALWLTTGATAYAALYCASVWATTGGAGLAVMAMTPYRAHRLAESMNNKSPHRWFRQASPASPQANLTKTGIQTLFFWAFFLWFCPVAITRAEDALAVPRFFFPLQWFWPWKLFVLAGTLGLWSGATMAIAGSGTPLPTDCPRRLVTIGPYAFLRNPMALAGLTQGAAIGLLLGSWSVLIFVLAGGLLWNVTVRRLRKPTWKNSSAMRSATTEITSAAGSRVRRRIARQADPIPAGPSVDAWRLGVAAVQYADPYSSSTTETLPCPNPTRRPPTTPSVGSRSPRRTSCAPRRTTKRRSATSSPCTTCRSRTGRARSRWRGSR